MRILISGAAGFIGSHLTDLLLGQGHEVVGIDNFSSGRPENVQHLDGHPAFSFVRQDVCEPIHVAGPIDRVYHLASPASPVAYIKQRVATLKANSQGTWNLLDLAVDRGARFLLASTSEVYGDAMNQVQREDYWGNVNPIGLRSVYEEAKRFAEACTMAYHRERSADTRIARIYNTYGPRMVPHDGRVVTNFAMQALTNEPITIFGDGTQTRSLVYVADLVRALALTMEGDFHEPINLGNPEEVSMIQLAREIIDLVPGSTSKIVFENSQAYDPRNRKPDVSRARQILGWSPAVPRHAGLKTFVESFKQSIGR